MYNANTKSILNDFFNFLKKPNDQQIHLSTKNKFSLIFKLLILELLFTLIIVTPLNYLIDEFITIKSPSLDYKFNTIYAIIALMVLIVPFVEEIMFRSILRYNSIFSKWIDREKWDRYFPYLVYTMSIAFGLVHASNYYNDSLSFYLLLPLIILSQLSGGFVLSYIRVRINFYYGFIYHALWNLIAALIIPSIVLLMSCPIKDHSKNYSLEIDEKILFNQNEIQSISIDSRDNKVYKIDAEQLFLQDILDQIYGEEKYYVDEYLIDMDFSSKQGVTKEEFKKILEKEYDIE
ncbi:CPBP family intramembrane glutamic endopeptidase [Chryseobacterium sp. JAH]|uniref:CPBP family intramembrane glutamic endopeptidase n=1 Tax=Chryseobacterium sp. JAH TaxID=1742858 RepID=UPI000647C7F9|nr:CPBP family intramembrane glutamic endopeptidase [Chryseobacterium sp. JAH]KUJ50832.1 hypothetical protein AR685_13715 [Chryseobacterium sp. JAH]